MEDIADIRLARNGEVIIITSLTPKGAAVVGRLFDEPNLTTNATIETDMHVFDLITKLDGCVVAMVDDEDPNQIYYIDDSTRHLH